jgi:6-pyruvoyltetrahydropterin/6-carboxytetrahydropterin synthase
MMALEVVVTRRLTFSAAHILRRNDWDDDQNRLVFGPCSNDHGHNYGLEVSIRSIPDAATGMVINLKDLDQTVKKTLIERVDHKHLNRDVNFLTDTIPTVENLAVAFWQQLEPHLGNRLYRLRLVETENNAAEIIRHE